MTAAARRDVGDIPAAEALEQLAELGAPGARPRPRRHVHGGVDSTTMSYAAGIEVQGQHPAGTAAGWYTATVHGCSGGSAGSGPAHLAG